ncbi:MAG: hypothetical protein A4S09_13260 [Proteobacteria bacterium SG_bin7]|nr:MAG: hypothetical protein A4S09_13260 [Proteobacteria bacterium SG_bin7]
MTELDHFRQKSGIKAFGIWMMLFILVWILEVVFAANTEFSQSATMTILIYAGINIILASSLNLVNGFTGQFSMGHAGFMAVGGYTSAFITLFLRGQMGDVFSTSSLGVGLFIVSLFCGGFVAALFGYVVGLPTLRLKGDYLAIVTLGFGEIIRVLILNMDFLGGARGLPDIDKFSSFGWVYTFVVLTVFCMSRLVHSYQGRALMAVREDELAAQAMGINVTQSKVRAFVFAAFFAGIAGGLFAHHLKYLNPQSFDLNRNFEIIIMVVAGGMGSITGSVVAAVFLTYIREALRELQIYTKIDLRMVIFSLVLIALMLLRPNGLFGKTEFYDYLPARLRKFFGKRGHAL